MVGKLDLDLIQIRQSVVQNWLLALTLTLTLTLSLALALRSLALALSHLLLLCGLSGRIWCERHEQTWLGLLLASRDLRLARLYWTATEDIVWPSRAAERELLLALRTSNIGVSK